MSDFVFTRRDFLKLAGIGVTGAASGCAQPAERLVPYFVAPNDLMPGVPYWYASTCLECPAGCGVLVKAREGRAIKIEGNPRHPVNRGGLCARGHAALQGLYDPDRVTGPMVRDGDAWRKVSWDDGLALAAGKLAEARAGARGIALLTGHATGTFERLCASWASAAGAARLAYEPFAYEAVREANRRTFGQATVANIDLAAATFVISFGADFLDTWGSPVGQARDFATLRARTDGGAFVTVEPRLSLTGANADEWVAIRPGAEAALALGMAAIILREGLAPPVPERFALLEAAASYTPDVVESRTDVPAAVVERLARRFAAARPSLAVAGGIAAQSEQGVAAAAAVNLLNYVAGNVGTTVRFDRALHLEGVGSLADLQALAHRMAEGAVGVLVVHGANPVYATPAWAGFAEGMDKVGFKVSLSAVMDETTAKCDLVLPSRHALETLGDAEAVRGVHSIVQPAMRHVPMFDTRPAGDALIALARGGGFGAGLPADWEGAVKGRWSELHGRFGRGRSFDQFWTDTLAQGGIWEDAAPVAVRWGATPAFASPQLRGEGDLTLVLYPSPALYDGRGANKSWLQELPDPTTKAVWGSWVEIHPETAAALGVRQGDAVKVETDAGSVEAPAYLYSGIRKDTIAIPLGQGHTAYGRHAKGLGINALALVPPGQDGAAGSLAYLGAKARVSKAPNPTPLVATQRHMDQHDREIAQIVPLSVLLAGHADEPVHPPGRAARGSHEAEVGPHQTERSQTRPGKYTEPRAGAMEHRPAHAISAFRAEHHARSPRQIPVNQGSYANAKHRWAMAIDLNSCTGCSACVVACHAENNVPMTGPDPIRNGREMHWIRIERYEEKVDGGANDVRFVPMMCQHCTDAPCETVCPVFATYHNPEGLNAQVYNRCVGTRYCSNNCPYKVRAFNFFDYAAPEKPTFAFAEPLNWQLNPDVTVRSKGVMEKCSMCVQRILEGKGHARDEERPLRDLEIQTACQQSCPTQAIVFGDLMDPESAVSKRSAEDRAYWVLGELNTKPGVTYLKKLARDPEHA